MKNTQIIFSLILIQLAVFYVKILNSSAEYWGGQIHYAPQPNYWRGHGPPAPPPIAPPMTVGTYCCVAVRRGRIGGARRFGVNRGRRGAGAYCGGSRTACLRDNGERTITASLYCSRLGHIQQMQKKTHREITARTVLDISCGFPYSRDSKTESV